MTPYLGGAADNGGAPLALQKRVIDIYRANERAVVKVFAAFDGKQPGGKTMLFIGTGFYISKEGHILTNTNITYGADRIWVERNGIAYAAELVGSDPLTNVSIIKVFALPADFQFLRLSDSPEVPPIGSFLVALTCELGQDPGPSLGLVSGWNTSYGERILPTIYLRSDIPSDGGEGGSPVFDINGSLVGMLIVSLPEVRSSFILPARAIQRIRDDILFSGKVTYAYFGFQTRQKSSLDSGPWVEVEGLVEGGPAALAGVKAGDRLLSMGDFAIMTDADLRVATFFQRPDEFVPVMIKRGDQEIELSVKPGAREAPPSAMPPVGVGTPEPPAAVVEPADEQSAAPSRGEGVSVAGASDSNATAADSAGEGGASESAQAVSESPADGSDKASAGSPVVPEDVPAS
ncbi:trypsin-like peptidase domain-containing protein [Ruficoccus amylovorans]|uniref:Trypsin-like peptidase domain-containing protein n=1 Tax=Ruficoccus amylovorans TaxID=1804625 RepID=A0A842HBJ2_9BACT|nr:S1C family serine protease [Ruficoccus amylovorans]MBC2593438.1 trypsin-like peptidase domain-containing protein [Ruficoccus amylovorans]